MLILNAVAHLCVLLKSSTMRAFTSILVFMLSVAIQSGPVSSEAQLSQLLFVKLRPEGVGGKKRTKV